MRLFIAGLITETNSFAACPTGIGAFEAQGIRRGAGSDVDPAGMLASIGAVRGVAEAAGVEVVEGLFAAANALGPVVETVYQALRGELLAGLSAALPVDAVVLLLHGSMVSERCDDCEGDILAAARALVGPVVPIGVSLDPHCHLTKAMVAAADVLVAYKEYPHTDIPDCAARTAELTLRAANGEITPVIAVYDCRMMGLWPTIREPLRNFVARMRALEGSDGILSVSLGHGMAYGDVPEAGSRLWVVADGDAAKAERLAVALGTELFAMREAIATPMTPLGEALDRLAAWQGDRPLALADTADNPGGGAYGDSSFILAALVARGLGDVALGGLWDPGAVQLCRDAGVGATFAMRLGGKTGPTAGAPVDVVATVMAVADEHSQDDFGARAALGASAWVQTAGGVDIVLISRVQQTLGSDLFTGLGVPLASQRGIVVKSMQHFLASFEPLIGGVVHVDTPGLMRGDFATIPFKRRSLNYWPRVADPFASQASAIADQACAPIGMRSSLKS